MHRPTTPLPLRSSPTKTSEKGCNCSNGHVWLTFSVCKNAFSSLQALTLVSTIPFSRMRTLQTQACLSSLFSVDISTQRGTVQRAVIPVNWHRALGSIWSLLFHRGSFAAGIRTRYSVYVFKIDTRKANKYKQLSSFNSTTTTTTTTDNNNNNNKTYARTHARHARTHARTTHTDTHTHTHTHTHARTHTHSIDEHKVRPFLNPASLTVVWRELRQKQKGGGERRCVCVCVCVWGGGGGCKERDGGRGDKLIPGDCPPDKSPHDPGTVKAWRRLPTARDQRRGATSLLPLFSLFF